ncbi:MAG: SUMF1/EgtB/PvdO family nonheme iron enzyme [Cyanobacterium sp. T60_A2020_053]|nr:SUMF1/EgtB/PvdO family nonheme iron enzyme [Cyanobacterium sp. T60_A2020_053]
MSNWKKGKQLNHGQYVIESMSLRGGAGIAYRAKEIANGKLVTIQTTPKVWQGQPHSQDLELKLVKQAEKIARCQHPHLVKIEPYVLQEDEIVYMVMDYLEGDDLATYLDTYGKLDEYSALKLITKIASAINLLHQNRTIHQDIKPQNIIIEKKSQEPILLDYGLAIKLFSYDVRRAKNAMMDYFSSPEISGTGMRMGFSSDIYSLSATLYVLVTGQLPTPSQFRQYKELIPPQQYSPTLRDHTNLAILRGMSLDPQDRPQCIRDWFYLFRGDTAPSTPPQRSFDDDATTVPMETVKARDEEVISAFAPEDDIIIDDNGIVLPSVTNAVQNDLNPKIDTFEFETFTVIQKKKLFGLMEGLEKNTVTKQGRFFVEYLGEAVNLDMIAIPAGSFLMGSGSTDESKEKDETPQTRIKIAPFFLGKYPITQLQWRVVSNLPRVGRALKNNPSSFKGDNLPVDRVSWYDAQEFCLRLSNLTKRSYRLPTEAEWEYACRGATNTSFWFGDIITPEFANYDGRKTSKDDKKEGKYDRKTTPVDNFFPNPFGLYDTHGNVWEWCEDHYAPTYLQKPKDGSAFEVKISNQPRIVRGGSWSLDSSYCRSAKRSSYSADSAYNFIGFRVVTN